jgi:hypothetical protein
MLAPVMTDAVRAAYINRLPRQRDGAAPRFPLSISNSKLEDAACAIKFRDKHIFRLTPETKSIHLCFGGAFASGLAAARTAFFIEGADSSTALSKGLRALLIEWDIDDPQISARSTKNIVSCCEALIYYLDRYPLPTATPTPLRYAERGAIEFSFALPIPVMHPETGEPLLYTGRADMIGGDPAAPDYLFIVDEKSTTYLGDGWPSKMRMRGQLMGYQWAAQEHGMHILASFIRGIAPRSGGDFDIAETPLIFKPYHIDRWYNSMLSKVRHMVRCFVEDEWPYDFSFSCTQFNALCAHAPRCMARDPDDMTGFIQDKELPWPETW